MVRPEARVTPGPVIIALNTPRRFEAAVNLVRRLRLPETTPVLLAAFQEPTLDVPSIFPTYRRRSTLVREGISVARRQAWQSVLLEAASRLAVANRKVDVVIRDEPPLQGLARLVEQTGAGLTVVGDSPFGLSSDRQTLSPITLARQLACTVLVAR